MARCYPFVTRKWQHEAEYRLIKELRVFTGARIAVCFVYEFYAKTGAWFRACGNENSLFDADGLMRERHAAINDLYQVSEVMTREGIPETAGI